MLGCFLLLFIGAIVLVLISEGGELGYRAAYKVLQTGQHVFESEWPERDGGGNNTGGQRSNRSLTRHERRVTPLTKNRRSVRLALCVRVQGEADLRLPCGPYQAIVGRGLKR